MAMGLYPTAGTARAADLAPAARRGHALGRLGVSANLALALGPLAGRWRAGRGVCRAGRATPTP